MASFAEDQVELLRGELAECEHRSDVSGRWLRMKFCPACGTTVSHTAEIRPGLCTIAAGSFDEPGWFKIDRHIWVQSKLPWVTVPKGMETHARAYTPSLPAAAGTAGTPS
jgi:hypothetical protein